MTQINTSYANQPPYGTGGADGAEHITTTTPMPDGIACAKALMPEAEPVRNDAVSLLKQLAATQADINKMVDAMRQARECRDMGLHLGSANPGLDEKFVAFCRNNSIPLPESESHLKDWDKTFAIMQTQLDGMESVIKTTLTNVHERMGEYASYLQSMQGAAQ
ncbi:MAG: hypothetical protein J5838_04080 [Desulfovibrio sp.]|nr:hypothetical protein [Desulfovibrio sp.]